MAVIISEISSAVNESEKNIIDKAIRRAGLTKSDIHVAGIYKTSLDARDNTNIKLVSSVWVETDVNDEERACALKPFCSQVKVNDFAPASFGTERADGRIVIAGFGPAGMFAALTLAEYGYKPLVLERGGDVDSRTAKVTAFWKNGTFDRQSNVQFGEGGAGTFSDGKLTTRIKDPLCRHILKKFTEFGAPEEILTKAKPHIGTDKLRGIVKLMRERIIELGGEVRFNSAVTDLKIQNCNINAVEVNSVETINTAAVIFAVGHSARDTFEMLNRKGICLEAKPFSIGARIEHTQESVNKSLYGKQYDNPVLPKGEYQLSYRQGERAVYTFCMCPGGYVVPSQSEENTIVTNGMSEFSRNGANANSALVVSVSPDDYGKNPLDGVEFAKKIEQKAYTLAGSNYSAPACTAGKLLGDRTSLSGSVLTPTYSLGVTECDFTQLFPKFVTDMMSTGLRCFSKKMKCFGESDAVLTGPETRTSSPVRILRNENMQSVSVNGLYPCGEGAGYAGGIMSAAVDGVKAAEKIIARYKS